MDGSIMSVAPSVCVGAQIGGGLILLICESCRRPQEDASASGRLTYSYTAHTQGMSGSSSWLGEGGGGAGGVEVALLWHGLREQS